MSDLHPPSARTLTIGGSLQLTAREIVRQSRRLIEMARATQDTATIVRAQALEVCERTRKLRATRSAAGATLRRVGGS